MADLKTTVCGIEFPNPIWTAAGPGGADAAMLLRAARGGAGGLVAKTISLEGARVPRPNIVTPFSGSLLNAELWSEHEYRSFIDKELTEIGKAGVPVIASVGYSARELAVLGKELDKAGVADAVEFSIHYVGKDPENLKKLASALKDNVGIPVLAKLSPGISDLEAVVRILEDIVDGFVAVNSVGPALDFDIETRQSLLGSGDGRGWLSGAAILPVALHYVEAIASLTEKPVIGVGGVRRVEEVIKHLMAGAAAVQEVYGKLATDLSAWLDTHGFDNVGQIIGLYRRERRGPDRIGETGFPEIDRDLCNFCLLCERSCIHQAIRFHDKEFQLDRSRCVRCGLCCSLCPKAALSLGTEL
jgi:dihydroorotate dehydrogenase/Pyruvate/2-oxoacid:ferredoxin oxidoreductase delta subunit